MLDIDGSQGEGGGQLLRSALAFSALTGRPFRLRSIRAKRQKPGLRAQHLAAVRLAAQLCSAQIIGDHLNSHTLEFVPGPLRGGHFRQEIGTAGSLVLLTQTALLPALTVGGEVVLELFGGTDVPMAPPLDYVAQVVLPYYRRLGEIELEILGRGFYPKGGGGIRLTVRGHGGPFKPLTLTGPTEWDQVSGCALATEGLRGPSVCQRMASAARLVMPCQPEEEYVVAPSPGAVLTLWCSDTTGTRWTGASTLARNGLPSERVGLETARSLQAILSDSRPADEHLADQLVPLLALTGGAMECQTVSSHCLTNIDICGLFSGARFTIEGTTVAATPKI